MTLPNDKSWRVRQCPHDDWPYGEREAWKGGYYAAMQDAKEHGLPSSTRRMFRVFIEDRVQSQRDKTVRWHEYNVIATSKEEAEATLRRERGTLFIRAAKVEVFETDHPLIASAQCGRAAMRVA